MAETLTRPRLDALDGWPLPEEQADWYGASEPEHMLAEAFAGGRMHHAWLIGGPKGIGKATLAYRFARHVLAGGTGGTGASPLAMSPDHGVFRKVAARAHPNLLILERPFDERTGRFKTELSVDEIRRTVPFFGSTPGEAGWRVAIVDSADEMNANAANALLKILEEPPSRALFLIISHAPGRLLPTIRSRCRRLDLAPLPDSAIASAFAARGETVEAADLALAARLAEGSLRRTVLLLESEGIELYREFEALVYGLPDLDREAGHRLADRLARREAEDTFESFLDILRGFLNRRVHRLPEPDGAPLPAAVTGASLESWAELWEKVARSSALAETLNLDRKQLILSILLALEEAVRG